LGLVIWKEVLGPVHVLGIVLIVVGVVVLNTAQATEGGASVWLIHRSAWKGNFQKLRHLM
jgi:drug/metabolite transporter (DMT)-like permease